MNKKLPLRGGKTKGKQKIADRTKEGHTSVVSRQHELTCIEGHTSVV